MNNTINTIIKLSEAQISDLDACLAAVKHDVKVLLAAAGHDKFLRELASTYYDNVLVWLRQTQRTEEGIVCSVKELDVCKDRLTHAVKITYNSMIKEMSAKATEIAEHGSGREAEITYCRDFIKSVSEKRDALLDAIYAAFEGVE